VDDNTATIDGKRFRLRSRYAAPFLRILLSKQGSFVPAIDIEQALRGERARQGERPSRVYKRLHPDIQALIDKPGSGETAYMLR
jgi:hypothetical protein